MSYVLVEFDDGGVAVVAKSWLTPRKKEVYWPPVKQQTHFDRYVKDLIEADTENWKTYNIIRQFYETDDFYKAQKKLKIVQYQSDLASDVDEAPPKRNRKRPVRFSSSESDSSPQNETFKKLKRPPRLCEEANTSTALEIQNNSTSFSQSTPKIVCSIDQGTPEVPNFSVLETNSSRVLSEVQSDLFESRGFQKRLLSLLVNIQEQNKKILKILSEKYTTVDQCTINLPIELPLGTDEDLQIFEDFLGDERNFPILVKKLSLYGGKDISSLTYGILKHLLKDTLAKNYSFFGKRGGKKPFSELRLKKCIIEAVQSSIASATERDIEDYIKNWLKHAPDRLRKAKN